jgi:hypothetical protein
MFATVSHDETHEERLASMFRQAHCRFHMGNPTRTLTCDCDSKQHAEGGNGTGRLIRRVRSLISLTDTSMFMTYQSC